MKILQVSNFFKPSWETGGVTKVNYELSKNLVMKGHEVTVYTTDGYSSRLDIPKNQVVAVDGIKVYYFFNLFRYLVKNMKFPTPYYLPFVLRKQIQKFDVIHIHEHRTLSAAIVHYYAKKHRVPYVLQSHGSVLPFLQKQKFKAIFDYVIGYSILKNAAKVIALNEDEAIQYQQMGIDKNKVEIIPNGIKLDEYNNVALNCVFKKMYNIPENDSIILYVGRVHRNKGIDLIVEALPLITKTNPAVKLVIMGPDGGFVDKLKELSKVLGMEQNVIFTGFVDKDVKLAAMADSNLFVTPKFSGFPMSFLEACVFGLPIVTTTEGDNLDWIHNKVGYIVRYDKSELCNAVLNILNDQELSYRFGNEAKNVVNSRFSMNAYIKKIETLYNECIGLKGY